ncbi:MAG: sigma-54-dependent Fis family transcriptional regulator [Deltaproteobacteria bacterium]|nr:MAG: sigma-54-dependent Fis family transcriptional regulator [Deltaproteobacteria bacterium]
MSVMTLEHSALLELDPEGGFIRFAGQRVLLLDATAMGLLRKYLVENFGLTAGRTVLTQFGFAHGWRMAESLQAEFDWTDVADRMRAGVRIHALEGLYRVELGSEGKLLDEGITVAASYEAEQHLLHFGRADVAICWTICGLLSGYASRVVGEDIYVLEDRCLGKGDPACHFIGRTREGWGDEQAEELNYFEMGRLQESLDISLKRVTDTLKVAEAKLREHRSLLDAVNPGADEPTGLIVRSPAMKRLIDLARRVARVDATILLSGESGVGKERIARLVHEESSRAMGPFVAINCAAITETLLESELFGHARGSFTGASTDRPGLFEAANHGTLLLDEISEISIGMQVKLLRVLQEREVRRVGENRSRKVDVRIIATTNRKLAEDVLEGRFRQDLYYRLKVVELHVPALRDRQEDILPLARLLLEVATERMDGRVRLLSPLVADRLLQHSWPGNVRELENAMERGAALARSSRVELEDLPVEVRKTRPRDVLADDDCRTLGMVEKEHILAVLEVNGGNQTQAARQLEIGTATLYRKLKAYREAAEEAAGTSPHPGAPRSAEHPDEGE